MRVRAIAEEPIEVRVQRSIFIGSAHPNVKPGAQSLHGG